MERQNMQEMCPFGARMARQPTFIEKGYKLDLKIRCYWGTIRLRTNIACACVEFECAKCA